MQGWWRRIRGGAAAIPVRATSTEADLAIERLARTIVGTIASEELAHFSSLARRYREDPRILDDIRSGKVGRLDFGSDERVLIVTLLVLHLLHGSIAPFLAAALPRVADNDHDEWDDADLLPTLTPEAYAALQAEVLAAARPHCPEPAVAEEVAAAVVRELRAISQQQLRVLAGTAHPAESHAPGE